MNRSTKVKSIDRKTKELVYARQGGKSIFPPYRNITVDMCCCHYISRKNGGVGYEWNIFGCYQSYSLDEHRAFDRAYSENTIKELMGMSSDALRRIVRDHMELNYNDWSETKCKYNKYYKKKDYGVERKK